MRAWMQIGARAVAVVLGALCLWNVSRLTWGRGDLNLWWIDLRLLPLWARASVLMPAGGLLLAFGLRPAMGPRRRKLTLATCAALMLVCLTNAAVFWLLVASGRVRTQMPVPASLLLVAAMAWVTWAVGERRQAPARLRHVTAAAVLLAAAAPFVQMFSYGLTDYRRIADAAVVFGAGVHADGRLSDALRDRMDTGIELVRSGTVGTLVVSGGPGMGAVHETEAMRRYALERGVPAGAIVVDADGLCTRATVENLRTVFADRGIRSALAVSHFYHLPRIKMAAQQAGLDLRTVPAPQQRPLNNLPLYLARESAAFWAYYLAG